MKKKVTYHAGTIHRMQDASLNHYSIGRRIFPTLAKAQFYCEELCRINKMPTDEFKAVSVTVEIH